MKKTKFKKVVALISAITLTIIALITAIFLGSQKQNHLTAHAQTISMDLSTNENSKNFEFTVTTEAGNSFMLRKYTTEATININNPNQNTKKLFFQIKTTTTNVTLTLTIEAYHSLISNYTTIEEKTITTNPQIPVKIEFDNTANYNTEIQPKYKIKLKKVQQATTGQESAFQYTDIQLVYISEYEDIYEKAYNEGKAQGYNEGYNEGTENGYNEGYNEGTENGYNEGYHEGYQNGTNYGKTIGRQEGYDEGYDEGYSEGNTAGYSKGKADGYAEGIATADNGSYLSLFSALVSAPVGVFTDILNFEILGVNLSTLAIGLLSVCLLIAVFNTVTGKR